MEKVRKKLEKGIKNRGDRIRTCDLGVPNAALHQAEPHPDEKTIQLKKMKIAQRPEYRYGLFILYRFVTKPLISCISIGLHIQYNMR